jgi:hypothetical protein
MQTNVYVCTYILIHTAHSCAIANATPPPWADGHDQLPCPQAQWPDSDSKSKLGPKRQAQTPKRD